jgi:hypothetical protein
MSKIKPIFTVANLVYAVQLINFKCCGSELKRIRKYLLYTNSRKAVDLNPRKKSLGLATLLKTLNLLIRFVVYCYR